MKDSLQATSFLLNPYDPLNAYKASRKPPEMARSAARRTVPPLAPECRRPSGVQGGAVLVAGAKLLDSPAIAIGVTEEHEPT